MNTPDRNTIDLKLDSLEAYLDSLDYGVDKGLEKLHDRLDPESVRQKLGILLRAERISVAAALAQSIEPHERWADTAVLVLMANGDIDAARKIKDWARSDGRIREKCRISFAQGALRFVLRHLPPDKAPPPQALTENDTRILQEALTSLLPSVRAVEANEAVGSSLQATALLIAMECARILSEAKQVRHIAHLLGTQKPIPVELGYAALRTGMELVTSLSERLRKEHPDSREAHLLAAMVEARVLNEPKRAFQSCLALLSQSETSPLTEDILRLLVEVAPQLGHEALQTLDDLLPTYKGQDSRLLRLYKALRLLNTGTVKDVRVFLEDIRDNEDPEWLQLYAGYHLKNGDLTAATHFLAEAAKRLSMAEPFRRAALLAQQDKRTATAIELLQSALAINPLDLPSHRSLAILLVGTKQFHDAAHHFQILQELDPNDFRYGINEALTLAQMGKLQGSLEAFQRVCEHPAAPLEAFLGESYLLMALNRPSDAFTLLHTIREHHWEDQDFLGTFITVAYAAGQDSIGHEVLVQLTKLQRQGATDSHVLQAVSLEDLRGRLEQHTQHLRLLDDNLISGRLPWLFADRAIGNVAAWGWALRTQPLLFLAEDRSSRARYSIYSTNSFTVASATKRQRRLTSIDCPPPGSVVADLSALITLFHLGLLGETAQYFRTILIPSAYLSMSIADRTRLLYHQPSRVEALSSIKRQIDNGRIVIREAPGGTDKDTLPNIDEYVAEDGPGHHHYRLIDLLLPMHEAGRLTDNDFEKLTQCATKPSSVDDTHPPIAVGASVQCSLLTLLTLTDATYLAPVTESFRISLTPEDHNALLRDMRTFDLQASTRDWYATLWDTLLSDDRYHQAPWPPVNHVNNGSEQTMQEDLALMAAFLALQKKVPLLADDRVCQAMVLNTPPKRPYQAFGTDRLLAALRDHGLINLERVADDYLKLIQWRYKFVLPTAELLKVYSDRYLNHPPGADLRSVARYVHDCMRDCGLLAGFEATHPPTTIASRLFLEWTNVISEFIMLCWADSRYDTGNAQLITDWATAEFLPSPPKTLNYRAQALLSALLSKTALGQAMIKSCTMQNDRAYNGLTSIARGLGLDKEAYLRIVMETIDAIS